jgi:hypothetical protein
MAGEATGEPRRSGAHRCTGVYRSLGDAGGSCSLGRHCSALPVVADRDAYRDSHTRFSDASFPLEPGPDGDDGYDPRPRSNEALLDVITSAMGRLDELNPPRD